MSIAVVWLKRDLRLRDHQPLVDAINSGLPVILLYCYEPMLINDPHYSPRHWQFIGQSLVDIEQSIPKGALFCAELSAIDALKILHQKYHVATLYSHQEVGLNNTFERDKTVAAWCRDNQINWQETPYAAVIRGLTHRKHWDEYWKKVMRAPQANPNLAKANWLCTSNNNSAACLLKKYHCEHGDFQPGGEIAAQNVMHSFFTERGKNYAYSLSSPLLSQQYCSRLSAYLAWGNVSLRQVYQTLLQHWHVKGWRRSLVALSSRLHWHCHFIQKFESESDMEFRPVNRGYLDLPRVTDDNQTKRLIAWQEGNTGIPMVDACMKCLAQTGYINFRMRAMLVSFLCHHLGVDWRAGVTHLARYFLDFEPGIHYSQFQMQAGVTGINTIRIYNPVKQGEEKDPTGEFVKYWLPELKEVPEAFVHAPWLLSPMEQIMYGVELGHNYPMPIVDISESYKSARDLLWQWRKKPAVKIEAQRLLKRHVRLD